MKFHIDNNIFNFKNSLINLFIFFFVVIVFLNQIHLHLNGSKFKKIENGNFYSKVENFDFKVNYSKSLSSGDFFNNFERDCKLTGSMGDRHQVRWVKSYFLQSLFLASEKINKIMPYYVNIFLHGFLIFLTIFILNKTFSFNHKYTFLILLYITFLFQNYLSEYSYSIFEMFFLSLALYASKQKNFILFLLSGICATLNRESGFIIFLSWLIFNDDYKRLIVGFIITSFIFVLLNIDIAKCLITPTFFIPFENQEGHFDLFDLNQINGISFFKLIILNFLFPFGLASYYVLKTQNKNKILVIMFLIYLLIFLIATPLHHISVRLILLPLICVSIFQFEKQLQKA